MFMLYPDIIILAGGLGTRLKEEVADKPKAMAPINGKPFLEFLLNYIHKTGFQRVIISTGYLSKSIENYFKDKYRSIEIEYAVEKEPLGTGGAIKLASRKVTTPYFIVLNGDTLFRINLQDFFQEHVEKLANMTIALRKVDDASRFGQVEIDGRGVIRAFKEKSNDSKSGLINGGVYIIKTKYFKKQQLPEKFSFEKDWLQKYVDSGEFFGRVFDDYFIDIGVPEDYKRAQKEFNEFND
jgi:D-glycero-alpha-D-manno-heptose 1-phosphate guanylyltransferase